MRVVRDVRDVLICHLESGDGTGSPFVSVLAQRDHCHSPSTSATACRHDTDLAFIVPEVGRFVQGSGKAIDNAKSSVRAD